jgi:Domain of unknown function (DUF4397)
LVRGTKVARFSCIVGTKEADISAGGEEIAVKFRVARWRATVLLVLLAFLVGIPAAASASSVTNTGWISLGNLSATTSAADLYLYPSGDSSPQLVEHDLGYGAVSAFELVNAGGYRVQMRAAGSAASSPPVLTAAVTVRAGHSYTVAALSTSASGRQLKVLDDSLTAPAGKSLVRVIQASVHQKSVTFHCSCAKGAPGNIATDAPPGSVSGYATIPPGVWTMSAKGGTATASEPVGLSAGTVHTEVVVDSNGGLAIENLVDAAGSGQPPSGGVDTGLGGTAPRGPGLPLPWLAVAGAGALLTVTGALRLRRNGLRRSGAGV